MTRAHCTLIHVLLLYTGMVNGTHEGTTAPTEAVNKHHARLPGLPGAPAWGACLRRLSGAPAWGACLAVTQWQKMVSRRRNDIHAFVVSEEFHADVDPAFILRRLAPARPRCRGGTENLRSLTSTP